MLDEYESPYNYDELGHRTAYSRNAWAELTEFERRAEFYEHEFYVADLPLDPTRNYLIWHDEYALYPYLSGQPMREDQWRVLCNISRERAAERLYTMGYAVEVTDEMHEAARRHRGSKYDTQTFPHGTDKGYWYGCTKKDECPASPTCWALGRIYRTGWKSGRQAQLRSERRASLIDQISELETQIEIRDSFTMDIDYFAQLRRDNAEPARADALLQLQADTTDALQRGDVAAVQRLTADYQAEQAETDAEIQAFIDQATNRDTKQDAELVTLQAELTALNGAQ